MENTLKTFVIPMVSEIPLTEEEYVKSAAFLPDTKEWAVLVAKYRPRKTRGQVEGDVDEPFSSVPRTV